MLPKKLQNKIDQRKENQSLRSLGTVNNLIDFSSNDYLGFANNKTIFHKTHDYLIENQIFQNGATGSRLLTGNHGLYKEVENQVAKFHSYESSLIFNSGYDANMGFFSCVPQRNDIILYDELCHASIRAGISMSKANAYKFRHNDTDELLIKIQETRRRKLEDSEIYVVTESVFSMDGDSPDLDTVCSICKKTNARLIVDEAHAVGVFGEKGEGLIYHMGLKHLVFASIVTFGKALGGHGAAILGSLGLKEYLINFSGPFIYTTSLPPHNLATIKTAYHQLESFNASEISVIDTLENNINFFQKKLNELELNQFIKSSSAIQSCIISGNSKVKKMSKELKKKGFDVKPILSPTVPKGKERLRFCLHSFNSKKEINDVLQTLAIFVKNANI